MMWNKNILDYIEVSSDKILNSIECAKQFILDYCTNFCDKFKSVEKSLERIESLLDEFNNNLICNNAKTQTITDRYVAEKLALIDENSMLKEKLTYHIATNECLKKEIEKYKTLTDQVIEMNNDKDKSVWSIAGSLDVVANGVFRNDVVEFACLKTYRGGWEYVFKDGKKLQKCGSIDSINIKWNDGSTVKLNCTIDGAEANNDDFS